MRRKKILFSFFLLVLTLPSLAQGNSFGSLPPFTKWYQNPLGVSPISLHTGNGLYLPAITAAAILIFTPKDTTLQDRVSFFNDLGVSFGYYGSRTTVCQNNLGLLFKFRKYLALGGEISIVNLSDDVNNAWGFGIRPFVRFYPIRNDHISVFFQSGAGLILFSETYPKPSGFFGDNREGTRLNGSPKYGLGAEFTISKKLSGQLALWHIHFSNGDHPSYERNPGHDSNGFSLGLVYSSTSH